MNSIHITHPPIYKEIGEAIRMDVSSEIHFNNHCWFKNNVQLNLERGYRLQYHCIELGTFATYKCIYQDTNGIVYCEEFHLLQTPPGYHPIHITPYSPSIHSTQLEPHPSVRERYLCPTASVGGPTEPTPSSRASHQFNKQQHPASIAPHPSIQGSLYVPVPGSSRAPEAIPPYYRPQAPDRDMLSYNQAHQRELFPQTINSVHQRELFPQTINPVHQRELFPQTINPVIQYSLQIEPHPSCQNVRNIQAHGNVPIMYTPVPCSTVKD